jgi:succinyl-diaminopimelate desuccinylase
MREARAMNSTDELIQKLKGYIDSDSKTIQDFFVQMLRINAVNPRMGGPGEEERARFLESFLQKEGFSVERVEAVDADVKKTRPNLSVKLEGKGPRNLWFVAHMDTVPEGSRELWQTDPFEPTTKDGKIIARGAEDNGQALTSSLFALIELKRLGAPLPFNVGVWLVADEEFGSTYGIKYLLSHGHFRKDDLVVVPDSGTPDGIDVEIAEKGLLWLKVTTVGKQVHASQPAKGLNAHRIGMKLAIDLDETFHRRYSDEDQLFDERRSTFEPTKIEPNVANVNTIPGVDVFCFDCRVLPRYGLEDIVSDAREKIRSYEKEYGASIRLDVVQKDSAGPATSDRSEVSILLARAVRHVTNTQSKFVGIGGQTVGNLFRKEGIPTAVWSTVDEVAHAPNEYSRIRNLIGDTKVFASLPLLA